MAKHNILGKWGEDIATEYLITKGYTIVERNWKLNHLEADIIAFKDNRVIVVEVKTRSNDLFDPIDSIDAKRQSHLVKIMNAYIKYKNLKRDYQFDYIFVIGNPVRDEQPKIEHIPDAFRPKLKTYR